MNEPRESNAVSEASALESSSAPREKTPHDADKLMDHEYDGIREYDNPMPGWWKALFWATVAFSFGYIFWFHVAERGTSVAREFAEDVAVANAAAAERAMRETVSEGALEKLMADATMMESGAALYDQRCKQCHADQGRGNIGPNLTDGHWIHGRGALMDIHKTVSEGVLAKGMPAWNKQLTPSELKQVVAYVGTLRGQNLPGKPPEGAAVPGAHGAREER